MERLFEHRHRFVGIARPAHEDVDGSEIALRPGVNADVGFRQDDDTGDAAALTELVKVAMQDGCPGGKRRLPLV